MKTLCAIVLYTYRQHCRFCYSQNQQNLRSCRRCSLESLPFVVLLPCLELCRSCWEKTSSLYQSQRRTRNCFHSICFEIVDLEGDYLAQLPYWSCWELNASLPMSSLTRRRTMAMIRRNLHGSSCLTDSMTALLTWVDSMARDNT